ncbi:alpha-protein kinase 2 [Arapaima gigas]
MFIPCSDRKPLFSGDPPLDQETNESKPICSSSSLSNVLSKTITLTDSFISDGKHTDRISLDIKDIQHCVIPSEIEHSGKTNRTASSSKHFEIVNSPSISETAMKKRAKTPQKTLQLCTEYKPPTHRKKKNKSSTSKMDAEESATQIPTKQENLPLDCPVTYVLSVEPSKDECVEVIETIVITEKITSKGRGKKKKRRNQSMQRKAENENDNQTSSKKKPDALQLKLESPGQSKNENMSTLMSRKTSLYLDGILAQPSTNDKAATFREKLSSTDQSLSSSITEETQSAINGPVTLPGEDTVKQKHLFQEKDDEQAPEIQSQEPEPSAISERNEVVSAEFQCKKLNKDVVKQKPHTLNRVPKILQNIQVVIAPNDFKSIVLQCRFGEVFIDSSVVWTKEGSVLAEEKRSAGDEGRVSFTIAKVSSKDLGWYRCCLSNHHGDASSEFHLTSDVLNELVPSHNHKVELSKGVGEDVKCMPLLFREDFLSEQYFGEDQSASILTEEVHFGEGMHRKAFRTKLLDGLLPFFTPGHACVLKVHTAISYGTKNHEELICKNYNLAMEECHVQNTAREYIKAYTTVAKCAEAFGDVPEIIPIYLVHRPTNDIPYATLEEELVGDFVKYSVKDGKEINLMRRDSEAGQKCCAFQHWVYDKTDGNLLITDMQGVGMKLTDVGIATGKKGYKGFKGNCATSFIDQFKALHQCNKFCEILGLKSLQGSQQKPGRKTMASKSKTPAPRNNVFAAAHKSKS